MQLHHICTTNSVLNSFLAEIRSVEKQSDSMRFRRNIERIGEVLSYEMSKSFNYSNNDITTPLGNKPVALSMDQLVICSILRAGLPLHVGVMNYFDAAESGFVSAYRKHKSNSTDFDIEVEYVACPDLRSKTLVLVDPMLATGSSLVATLEALTQFGQPKEIHVISVIASKAGVAYVKQYLPSNAHLWVADIDNILDDKGYIIPGLGDAGDLAYGEKLQK